MQYTDLILLLRDIIDACEDPVMKAFWQEQLDWLIERGDMDTVAAILLLVIAAGLWWIVKKFLEGN